MQISEVKFVEYLNIYKEDSFEENEIYLLSKVYPGIKRKYSYLIYDASILDIQVLFIYKREDSWFFIKTYNKNSVHDRNFIDKYYKCDGFDELKEVLKTIPIGIKKYLK